MYQEFFKDRTIYYSTFPIREQAQRGGDWDFHLNPVYTIGLLNFNFADGLENARRWHHEVKLTEVDTHEIFYDKLTYIYVEIPKFDKLIATIRSREISASIILQSQSQLKAIYKDNADTIIGNMDCQVFLGGSEPTTLKELSEALGKETIDTFNTSDTRGNSPSYGTNYQKLGKELMSRDELAVMDGSKCVLQLRGVRPFLSDKYDLTQHPNYKYTADYDKKLTFDIEKYLSTRAKLYPKDEFFVMEEEK